MALYLTDDHLPRAVVRTRPGYFAPSPPPIRPSIEFTIRGRDREYYDVAADDLLVFEDGVEQRVDTFQEAVDPVSIVMLLDQSGSMVKASEAVKAAARSFVAALRPEDSLAVAMFSDGLLFAHDLTKNRDHSIDAISDYTARGGTALYDALHGAFGRLKSVEGRRVVVVLTDGRDENNPGTAPGSVHTIGDVLRGIKESRTTVFTIGLGPKVDEPVLAQIARESGGEVFLPADVTALEGDYQRIVENLRRRYVVAYTSTNSARDGAWRHVEIKTVAGRTAWPNRLAATSRRSGDGDRDRGTPMRTSGKGNDTLMTLVPLAVLLAFGTFLAGGPGELLEVINGTVRWAVEGVRGWTGW